MAEQEVVPNKVSNKKMYEIYNTNFEKFGSFWALHKERTPEELQEETEKAKQAINEFVKNNCTKQRN